MIITLQSFIDKFNISSNIEAGRIERFIKEAEDFDVKNYIGAAFFYKVKTEYAQSPADEIYTKLVDGGVYEKCGEMVEFNGLGEAVRYYAFARFRTNHYIQDTRYGTVVKGDDYSEPASRGVLKDTQAELRAAGQACLIEALDYAKTIEDFRKCITQTRHNITITTVTNKY